MAKVVKYTYGVAGWDGDAAIGKAFFDSLNCSLITATSLIDDSTFSITIDNLMVLTFSGTSNTHNVTLTYDGTTTDIGWIQNASSKTFTVSYSDNFIIIDFKDYYPRYWYYVYEKINTHTYYGHYKDHSNNILSEIQLTDISTGLSYQHGSRIKYSAPTGTIYYTGDALFEGTIKAVDDPNFVSCSTITAKQVVSFREHNYYSIDPNILVPLDSEVT